MGFVSVVSIVLCMVSISIMMIINWFDIHLVGVMVHWVVINMVFFVMHWVMFNMVLFVMLWVMINMVFFVMHWVRIVVHFMVSRLCYMWSRVVLVVTRGDVWLNMVLFIILVLHSVS